MVEIRTIIVRPEVIKTDSNGVDYIAYQWQGAESVIIEIYKEST